MRPIRPPRRRLWAWLALTGTLAACSPLRDADDTGSAGNTPPIRATAAAPGRATTQPAAGAVPLARYNAGDHGDADASLSEAIEQGLRHDEYLIACHLDPETGVIGFDPGWFSVSRVDLDGDGRTDWIVSSSQERGGACDGQASRWWLYQEVPATGHVPTGQRLLLTAPGTALTLAEQRRWGFPDIVVRAHHEDAGARRYRYDGQAYVDASAPPLDPLPAVLAPLYGQWDPADDTYPGAGPLVLDANRLDWGRCRQVDYRLVGVDARNGEPVSVLIQIDDSIECEVAGQPLAYLDLRLQPGDCRLEAALHASEQAALDGPSPVRSRLDKRDCVVEHETE